MALLAATVNASLLDCSKTPNANLVPDTECKPVYYAANASPVAALKEAIPVATSAAMATGGGFKLNQTRTSDAVTDSAPLFILICALVGVILIRAKSYNSK